MAAAPNFEWVRQLGSSGDDRATDLATDSTGNIYVTGYTLGGLDGNTNSGYTTNDIFLTKYSSSGTKQWTKQLGSSANDYANGIAIDQSDNIFVTGYTEGSLPGNTLVAHRDLFIIKFDTNGNDLWIKQHGTDSAVSAVAQAIDTDSDGNVYITGYTGGGSGLHGNTSSGGNDIFVAKYDDSGTWQWTEQIGTADSEIAFDITIDSSSNVYVTGYTQGGLDGNTNAGASDLFIIKYDNNGAKQWTQQLGTSTFQNAYGITNDSSDNIYITGNSQGSLDDPSNTYGDQDIFVAKFDGAGNLLWHQLYGTPARDMTRGIVCDSSDNIYLTGWTYGNLDGHTNAGGTDIFVIKVDTAGIKQWTMQYETTSGTDIAARVTADASGNVYVTGWTDGDFDGNLNAGSGDIFVAKIGVPSGLAPTEIAGSLGPWTDSNANYLYVSASWSVQDWSDLYSTNSWAAVVYIDSTVSTVRVHDSSLGALSIDGTPVASKRFATQAEAEALTVFDSTTPGKEDWKLTRIAPNNTIARGPTEVTPHPSTNKIKRLWSIVLYNSNTTTYTPPPSTPPPAGLLHITPADTEVDEGGNLLFNIGVQNIPDGDQVTWSLTNVTDFTIISGTATITADTGSFTVSPTLDNTTEGDEIFTAEISYNGDTLISSDVTIRDTSLDPPPTYNIAPTAVSVDEGSTATFNVTTTRVPDGTVLYWEVSRPEDFSTATGFVSISGGAASFTVMPDADSLTEYDSFSGDEDFFVRLRLNNASGAVVAISTTVIINDTSKESSGASAPVPLVVPPSAPAPVGNAGGGTGANPKGSGIYQEWFQYTSSPSEPTPTWREHVPDTQSVHIDLQYRPALTSANDAPAGGQPNEVPSDSWSAGPSYYLYARWKDKATNISDLITTSFKIDNGDPYTVTYTVTGNPKVLNAGGHVAPKKILDDYVYSIDTVTDDHSGVVYYTHTVNGANYHKEVLATSYSQGRAAPNDEYVIDEQITIGSTPGNKTVEIRAYDQAENYKVNSFNVIRSSQSIIWHTLTAQRSTLSPFVVEGHLKVEITNTPELIAGFFGTVDLYNAPPDVNFDQTNATQIIYDIPFAMTVPDLTVTRGIMHIMTDGSPRSYAQKGFTFTNSTNSATGGISAVADPTLSIREATSRVYTNTLLNNYGVDVIAGTVTPGGSQDRLTAFKITDTASSPGTPPVYNPATLKFEDQAAVGWRMYVDGTAAIAETEPHSFSNPAYGPKKVYLHCCTHAFNGTVDPPSSTAKTFDTYYDIEYINDNVGPWLTSANVLEVTGGLNFPCSQTTTPWSDTNHDPITHWDISGTITQDGAITVSGVLTDNESKIKRWVVGPFASPPAYSEVNPGLWTVLGTPNATTNFNYSVTLAPPNSQKTLYVWAVDIVGNMGKHMISVDLNVAAFVIPILGTAHGSPYKFEGKPAEHKNRESIASMFGDGVQHTGMISNKTPHVQGHRVHLISEYQGLRVANTANDDYSEFLPSNTIKFSDFLNKKPWITDMNVAPTEIPHDVFSPSEPQYVGDTRNISLTMDIDTGISGTPYVNDNVVDDDASWTATFLPEGGGTTQIIGTLNVVNGVIQNYIFANPGTYIFIGTSSFGDTIGKTFSIYKQGTPLPPIQGPPILVDVDLTNDPTGETPVTIDYKVDQVGIALDAAIAIDRSGSYVRNDTSLADFAGALSKASQTSKKVRLVLLEEATNANPNLPKSGSDKWSVLALFENIVYANQKSCLLHAFPNLKYLWDPTGSNTITSMPFHGSMSNFSNVVSLAGSAEVLQTGTGPYSELAQSVRDGHDLSDPNSHSWNSSTGMNNRYWYTKAHHAEDTLLRALDDFTRSSISNAVNTRWRVTWFPLASIVGVEHRQGWTTKESDVVNAIDIYKDSMGHHHEPKIQAVAELAKGDGLSTAQLPAWRQTAAKLILLFADEEDGGQQNSAGSLAKYKDSGNPEYYIKLLTKPKEEIGFVLMDGDRDNRFLDSSDPNYATQGYQPVKNLNNVLDAVALTRKYGGYHGTLKISSSAADIASEMKNAFANYRAGITFDLLPAISNPQIMKSNPTANPTVHAPGTAVPIPFDDLIAYPNSSTLHYHRAVFDVKLDNAQINTLGVNYIILYVSIKNSSDMEIARREVRIRVV